jgi:hypothetical protein
MRKTCGKSMAEEEDQKPKTTRDGACKYESRTPIAPLPLLQQKIKNTNTLRRIAKQHT